MLRYAHTNIIARDADALITFYKEVFGCKSIGETRDIRAAWLDRLTGIEGSHIVGEHLLLPGYGEDHPTLEIFSYDAFSDSLPPEVNTPGIAHIAFEVDDVEAMLQEVIAHGGSKVGELVSSGYPDGSIATFVYARDPEGNILELQSWSEPA